MHCQNCSPDLKVKGFITAMWQLLISSLSVWLFTKREGKGILMVVSFLLICSSSSVCLRAAERSEINTRAQDCFIFPWKVGHIPSQAVFYSCKYILTIKNATKKTTFMSTELRLVELGWGWCWLSLGLGCAAGRAGPMPSALDVGPQSTSLGAGKLSGAGEEWKHSKLSRLSST